MKIAEIIGQNIDSLMKEKNLSVRKTAELINVTHPTMSKYISGEQIIDSEKLLILANYFGKSFDFFFEEAHETFTIMLRADKPSVNFNENDYNYIFRKIIEYNDIVENRIKYIPQEYFIDFLNNKISSENESFIEKIALEQRRFLKIENIVPENYFTTISEAGINVLCFNLENETLFGASSYSTENGSYIFINSNKKISLERQIFSLIHELAHLLFHRNQYLDSKYNPYYTSSRNSVQERVANSFAGYFLLPKNMVKAYINERQGTVSPLSMKKFFKVSLQTLYLMLHKYKIILKETYKKFWQEINKKGLKKIEPEPLEHLSFEKMNEKLIDRIKKLFFNDLISINKISGVIEKDSLYVRKLVKNWGSEYEELITVS